MDECEKQRHGVTNATRELRWRTGPFTVDEMVNVVSSFGNHKSAGPDGFRTEVLKVAEVAQELLHVMNKLREDPNSLVQQMLDSTLVPLLKKGDVDEPTNYRGICLLSVLTKVLNKLILLRIRDAIDPHLHPSQNAYRPERNCQQHLLAAAEMINFAKSTKNEKLFALFVDFSKAFDSIDRRSGQGSTH